MDLFPSKRRKISPTTSLPVIARETQAGLDGQDVSRRSSQGVSFMSPTKASIARFYPNLLPRSISAEPRGPSSTGKYERSRRARTTDYIGDTAHENDSEAITTNATGSGKATNGVHHVSERARSPAAQETPSKLPRSTPTINATSVEDRNGVPVTPTHRNPRQISAVGAINGDVEPSLPSTPSQLGLEPPPEKPKGLLFHSPSKRPRRKDGSAKKSSPLKPRDPPPRIIAPPGEFAMLKLGQRVFIDSAPKPPPSSEEVENAALRKSLQHLELRLKNLQETLTSISMLSRWHEIDAKSKKSIAKKKKEIGKEASEISKLRARPGYVDVENRDDDILPKVQTTSQCLGQSLPFRGRPWGSPPKLPPTFTQEAKEGPNETSPFAIKILSSTVHSVASDDSALVRQDIEVLLPQRTRFARLQLRINPTSQVVSDTKILDITVWAASEMTPWLTQCSVENTLANMGYAIGRYLEVSRLRANCWSRCMSDFPSLASVVDNTFREDDQFFNYGASRLDLVRSSTKLTIEWHISLSNAGDLQSKVSSITTFPEAWEQLEGGAELGKIDAAFDGLMRERGVTEAILTIAKILFPP